MTNGEREREGERWRERNTKTEIENLSNYGTGRCIINPRLSQGFRRKLHEGLATDLYQAGNPQFTACPRSLVNYLNATCYILGDPDVTATIYCK